MHLLFKQRSAGQENENCVGLKLAKTFAPRLALGPRHVSKNIEIPGSHYFSSSALSNLLTQTGLHFHTTSSEHAKYTFITFVCLSVPTYCILIKLNSQKKFSLIYLTVSVVRQHNEYEIETET